MVNVGPETTTEGERPDVSRSDGGTWFGHPRQLARLFTTEAMERFGYYGMRALLTLYLAKHFLFSDHATTGLYGGFTALVYLTPLIGGLIADRYLGSKRSVKFGALMMALGYFTLCFGGDTAKPIATIDGQTYAVQVENFVDRPTSTGKEKRYVEMAGQRLLVQGNEDGSVSLLGPDNKEVRKIAKGGFEAGGERSGLFTALMLIGLSLVTVGNGFFKPNISTIVGSLYEQGDRRRDAGFTIFYMGINLGSFFSQLFCPFLADTVGWWAGFGLAAVGMLTAACLFQFDRGLLDGYGEPPEGAANRSLAIYLGAVIAVPVVWFLFTNLMNAPAQTPGSGLGGYLMSLPIMGKVLFGTFLIAIPAILIWSWRVGDRREFQMMLAAIVLVVFNVVFWTLFEQAGSSLTLFADRNTDLRLIGNWSISAGQTQSFNAIFIVLLAPLFSMLWTGLAARQVAPDGALKGLGYVWTAILALVGLFLSWRIYLALSAHPLAAVVAGLVLAMIVLVAIWNWYQQVRDWREKTVLEPSIPVKFAAALVGVGLGFLFLVWGSQFAGDDFKVGIWWLAGLYLIHSMAELCISPVGLSMITKLSIARVVGLMMGVWFLSISVAQYVGGAVAQVASVETVGGQVTNLKVSLDTYAGVFWTIGLYAAGIGVFLLLLSPLIKKWMHGVQ